MKISPAYIKADYSIIVLIGKAKKWFPLFQELVYMEKFCLKVGFNERQTATLISGKPLFYEGELYSEEHKRKFTAERAGFQVVKDPKDRSKLALAINGQLIGEWFREQLGRLFSSVKKTVEPLRRGKARHYKQYQREDSKFVFWADQNHLHLSRWSSECF